MGDLTAAAMGSEEPEADGAAPAVGGPATALAGSSVVFAALTAVLAASALFTPDDSRHTFTLAAVGLVSCGAVVLASVRIRSKRLPSWTGWQRDPFLAFAAALAFLVASQVVLVVDGDASLAAPNAAGWLLGLVAAGAATTGFLVMVRDLTPGRAVEALLLACIVAIEAGLGGWVLAAVHLDASPSLRALSLLGSAAVDVTVVAVGLQVLSLRARARAGVWLLVVGWTLVLSADVARVLGAVHGDVGPSSSFVAIATMVCGLFGAAAFHPSSIQAADPYVGPRTRLPRGQVGLLVGAVLIGPVVLASEVTSDDARLTVLCVSGALALLVVLYLVRLVQGRAVVEHRAHHDELTGLANRSLFEDRAEVAIAHTRRVDGHTAVLFLDLDRFKTVNDSLGHAMGNQLLQAVAKRLRAATRAEDTVARLGGDEFAVLLPHLEDPDDAAQVAAKILAGFDEPFVLAGHRLFASPSIGIAVSPGDGDDADLLTDHADIAMYRAKQAGRRRFCTYDRSMNDHAHERLALENQLHGAIQRGELVLHYQPKIHLQSGRVTGMEALLRWEHPGRGLLMPSAFIPLAEESGMIVEIGEWALQEACRQNRTWHDAGFSPLVVAVNLSLRQFQHERVDDMVARALRTTGLDPALLELEVTESLAMHDPERVVAMLTELKGLGVTCSIDDFGTGYAGLSHLMGFPVDRLKIDKSFVATIDGDREAPIVVAVVALARGMGLSVVAEGVETAEQLERLRELGCDEMQGFLFSQPVPPQGFEQLLMLEAIAPGPGRLGRPDGWRHIRAVS